MTSFTNQTKVFVGYADEAVTRKIAAGGISVAYQQASEPSVAGSGSIPSPAMVLDLMPLLKGSIVPGSLRFKLGSYHYIERAGTLYHSVSTSSGAGMPAGTINYQTGEVVITSWPAGAATFVLESGLIRPNTPGMALVTGRAAASPIKSQSFAISATALDGTLITATAGADGLITGPLANGAISYEKGTYTVSFGSFAGTIWTDKMVDPGTIKYNAVSYSYLPLDASVIGIDPVRLPQDGKVPIFRPGNFVVIGHTAAIGPLTVSNGQMVNCNRVRLSRVRVLDVNGNVINSGYTADLDGGTVTFNDITGYLQPIKVEHRIEDMAQVSDVQINGLLFFTRQLTHDFPAGSYVSSALIAGDMHAHITAMFDQATWSGAWADTVSGSGATSSYNDVLAPIELSNKGAITERWAIQFTNTTTFNVIGEHVGVIATGNTSSDLTPINPATGQPYFTLRAVGWGSGWSAGNVLRFNTSGPVFPVWVVRTVQQGPETVTTDSFTLLIRGDVDRP